MRFPSKLLSSTIAVMFFATPQVGLAFVTSPFNQLAIVTPPAQQSYTFYVGGHLYGRAGVTDIHPAPTFVTHLDRIRKQRPLFFISLGDLMRETSLEHIAAIRTTAERLDIPLLNAVGNHDVTTRDLYADAFGETYRSFSIGRVLYVLLDTELDDGSIRGDQLSFLQQTLAIAEQDADIATVVVFAHRMVWLTLNRERTNFASDVEPLLRRLSMAKRVYWFSGDLGGDKTDLPLFYTEDPVADIAFIATGICDCPTDALLRVTVHPIGTLRFQPYSLTDSALPSLKTFTYDYWRAERPLNPRVGTFALHNTRTVAFIVYRLKMRLQPLVYGIIFQPERIGWAGALCILLYFVVPTKPRRSRAK